MDGPNRPRVPPRDVRLALPKSRVLELLRALADGWRVIDDHHLARELRFPDFVSALAYVNRVGAVAEELDHHPNLELTYGRVTIQIWTHARDGLTELDFLFAAHCDGIATGPDAAGLDSGSA